MRTIYFVRVLDRRKLIRNTNRNLFKKIKSQHTKMLLTVLTGFLKDLYNFLVDKNSYYQNALLG